MKKNLIVPLSILMGLSQFYVFGSKAILTNEETNNPYIVSSSFDILEETATSSSIEFSMKIIDNDSNDFYNEISNPSENDFKVNILSSDSLNRITQDLLWETDDMTKPPADDIYTFKFYSDHLIENSIYQIYSINGTNLAIDSATNPVDDEIIITDDLGVTDNNFTTTNSNPYIIKGDFEITEVTESSVEFQIKIVNDYENSFSQENMSVTLEDSVGYKYQTNATYQSWNNGYYTYKITELESGVPFVINETYTFYSLNNTGLAIGSEENAIDNEIIVADDLGVTDNNFTTTISNPYIIKEDFEITEITESSVEFQIKIINDYENSFAQENMSVTLEDSDGYKHQTNATYQSKSNDYYTYKITELESGVPFVINETYTFYSLNNTGLAVGSEENAIDNEILIEDELLVTDNTFTTSSEVIINPPVEPSSDIQYKILAYILFSISILLIIVGIIVLVIFFRNKKKEKEIESYVISEKKFD